MGLLSDGQAFLNAVLGESEGVTVTYSRQIDDDTTHSVILTARTGRTLFKGVGEGGLTVKWGERDFLIEVADLILNGESTTPDTGDRITHGTEVWELTDPDTGEHCWRYSDNGRTLYRVHCKRHA